MTSALPTYYAAAGLPVPGGMPAQQYATAGGFIPLDRLVRKEVALGMIREIVPPETHIGLSYCPWLEVQSDDVIFDYAQGITDGLAPARAEDSESELAQKDDLIGGQGRASILDWALKDHYVASDVTRYREFLAIAEQLRDMGSFPLFMSGNMTDEWQAKIARDTARRRRKLDNRIEWLIMNGLYSSGIVYNDGKIKFTVDYGRPLNQFAASIHASMAVANLWTTVLSDPIRNILSVQEYMYDLYGVRITRAITSRRVLNSILNSDRFAARSGLVGTGAAGSTPIDPRYLIDGWGPAAAQEVVAAQTGLTFIEYDAVFRTRAPGSKIVTSTRYIPEDVILYLPDEADINEFDDTEIGFAKLLTSPHPEGNWAPGFYEWERTTVDPWGHDMGTGVKAFPVFNHMELTVTQKVIP